jgi:predicted nuclease of restriction endonuclease-like (RecB) superfamily
MDIQKLANMIVGIHCSLQLQATTAVNISLSVRNWLIGYYLVEYEQNGEDRAKYGERLLPRLSEELKKQGLVNISVPELRRFRIFYSVYPCLCIDSLNSSKELSIRGISSHAFTENKIRGIASHESESVIAQEKLLKSLSFSHFVELIKIEDSFKRAFYEVECINGTWSVSELKRQIASLYFERSSLSLDKKKLSALANRDAHQIKPLDLFKDPFVFEFLGLPTKDAVEEADLEAALIDNLQQFLLELGNGFCFEARQKRILIDDEYCFIDLVFYHRILKCHVLVDLKTEAFNHENIGQLQAYLEYYRENMMQKEDRPPVGILLCTESKPQMVRYALSNSKNLFVSKYKLQLPSEEELQYFIEQQLKRINKT